MRRRGSGIAAGLALLASIPAGARPAAPCVTGPQAEALVITAVPALVATLRVMCAPRLPANATLMQSDGPFIAKYQAESDAVWPLAKAGLARIAGPDLRPMLDSGLARPALAAMVGPLFAADFHVEDCAPTERLVTMLAPLPPRNAAAALVVFLQMVDERRRKDPAKPDLLPICRYGQQ